MALFDALRGWIPVSGKTVLLTLSISMLAIAVACSGGDDDSDDDETPSVGSGTQTSQPTVTPRPGSTATPRPGSTVAPGATATTATGGGTPGVGPTATATARVFPTVTPTPTATPLPANAIAAAGNDIDTRIGNFIGLNGSGSSDPDGDALTYTWTQVNGPDVTGGAGIFLGPTPSFAVPSSVSTLVFELTVNDGNGESAPDTVLVNVFEHLGNPGIFVDGNSGSNETGDGTRENPYASIGFAISSINGPDQDIHVMSIGDGSAYEEENTLSLPVTTSLYGGYGPGWVRDAVNNKTRINGHSTAVRFRNVDEPAWFSGFDVTAADATSFGESVFALRVDGGATTLIVEDNILTAGHAGAGDAGVSPGSSYGLFVGSIFNIEILRNEIFAGNGGAGDSGAKGNDGSDAKGAGGGGKAGEDGGNAGSGGGGGNSSIDGGRGGAGGGGLIPTDGGGGTGGEGPAGNGGIGDEVGDGRVGDGKGGGGGAGGNGGVGGAGAGGFDADGLFETADGRKGGNGGNGGGGGGGGGGAGGVGLTGGGGGGGGGGGAGGIGGGGGQGGGASIGVLLYAPVSSMLRDNVIIAANGGAAGRGGAGGTGGDGKGGGVGGGPQCSFLGCDIGRSGDGGEGGGGGAGGIGGQGGGGAGGPSYGIVTGPNVGPAIIDTVVSTGDGGNGGIGGAAGLGGSPGGDGGSTGGSGGCCSFLLETAGDPGSGGDGGWSFAIYDIDPNDDFTPTLTRTELEFGQPGSGVAIGGSSGQSGEINS